MCQTVAIYHSTLLLLSLFFEWVRLERRSLVSRVTPLKHTELVVDEGTFTDTMTSSLRTLDLRANNMGSDALKEGRIFQGLSNLRTLRLSLNRLSTVHDGTFSHLPSLRTLEIWSQGDQDTRSSHFTSLDCKPWCQPECLHKTQSSNTSRWGVPAGTVIT